MGKLDLILLIDDSDADNHYHSIIIERSGIPCRLKSIEGSLEGIGYLRKGLILSDNSEFPIPQLIFLDINMPGLNGFELLQKFKESPDPYDRKKDIKIFMLTGSLNPDDKILAREKFPDLVSGFIVKPLTKEALLSITKEHFSS